MMRIGQLAAATETNVETIRYYERAGLLLSPDRTVANYRMYGERHVRRLSFIRHCRHLDMSLDEIRVLLPFLDAPHRACEEVNTILDMHIGHVSQRIHELRQLEVQLKSLRAQCTEGGDAARCGILAGLAQCGSSVSPRLNSSHLTQVHKARESSD
jgi:Cd(II)/Pb(II)-responsive transcriptional regulator